MQTLCVSIDLRWSKWPYRSKTRPDTAFDSAMFTHPIANTFLEMHHDSPYVLDLSKALDYSAHRAAIVGLEEDSCHVQPFVDHSHI